MVIVEVKIKSETKIEIKNWGQSFRQVRIKLKGKAGKV